MKTWVVPFFFESTWPEVITEGKTLEKCREMLKDALNEMINAYRQQKKKSPPAGLFWNRYP